VVKRAGSGDKSFCDRHRKTRHTICCICRLLPDNLITFQPSTIVQRLPAIAQAFVVAVLFAQPHALAGLLRRVTDFQLLRIAVSDLYRQRRTRLRVRNSLPCQQHQPRHPAFAPSPTHLSLLSPAAHNTPRIGQESSFRQNKIALQANSGSKSASAP
jgi:hypothetical protein